VSTSDDGAKRKWEGGGPPYSITIRTAIPHQAGGPAGVTLPNGCQHESCHLHPAITAVVEVGNTEGAAKWKQYSSGRTAARPAPPTHLIPNHTHEGAAILHGGGCAGALEVRGRRRATVMLEREGEGAAVGRMNCVP